MIFHKYKCIFIHIPKCAGSSISKFLADGKTFAWKSPNYEFLFGWCPKRNIHLQHATVKQLLETELITEEIWKSYNKFTVVRNPWDRCYSDYLWMQKDTNIKGSFKDFIYKQGPFQAILNFRENMHYRGDHLLKQTDFFDLSGLNSIDFIARFENLSEDFNHIISQLNINKEFNVKENISKNRHSHYSYFYTKTKRKIVEELYGEDISILNYKFDDKKKGIYRIKNLF